MMPTPPLNMRAQDIPTWGWPLLRFVQWFLVLSCIGAALSLIVLAVIVLGRLAYG